MNPGIINEMTFPDRKRKWGAAAASGTGVAARNRKPHRSASILYPRAQSETQAAAIPYKKYRR
jgi:hypothetical protein